MRLFVAVVPPEEVVDHLDAFLEPRREHGRFRWTSAEQLHVTLAFLEQVPERSLDALVEGLQRGAARRQPFEARVAGGGAFPDPAHAKVLWAGLDLAVDARAELDRLAAGARAAASHAGLVVDGQRFRPHVTLARLGRGQEVTRWVRLLDGYAGPAWTVDRVVLVESHLGEGPRRRPRHEPVAELELGATTSARDT
ncbi:RNA 2',3'-cyclic phosphodiesterase [Nocardioides sp.]|uniref:RNA 2',3'-cyclic phosphodiesterase n=1 Tax=Nocardioides sp. TaxID=35761 RepID=UPI00271730AD|nr:RNA 2',3'-cyclic phosphodiesterase [Nocardioides sp.]MDO9457889.1 RNA 2',3'-cyclic phosphodiesterase [Nocardioides sp.]